MINTDLLPAQVIFLHQPKKLKIHEALSFVIRDLVIRKVLTLNKKNSFPNDRSRKTQKYHQLSKGVNFKDYEPQDFEKNLIAPFNEINRVQIKTLTNFVLRRYSMPSAFIKVQLLNPLRKEGYINNIPLLKSLGIYSITAKGKEIAQEFDTKLSEYEEKISSLIDGDKEQFYNTLMEMGTYVFKFEYSNPELYKNIESMIRRIYKNLPFGQEKDLQEFYQAMNLDLGFFHE